jgi:putative transcriptional regulator
MNGRIYLNNLKPHPKNPTIANFFRQLGWVEELGSGIRRMYKYCPLYVKNSTPVIEEGDVFKLVIPYNPISGGINKNEGVNNKELLLKIITKNEGLNVNELAERLGKSRKTVERYVRALRSKGILNSMKIIISFLRGRFYLGLNRCLFHVD